VLSPPSVCTRFTRFTRERDSAARSRLAASPAFDPGAASWQDFIMECHIDVRSAQHADLPRVAEILVEAGLCKPEGLHERLVVSLERSPDTCFVAVEGGVITGAVLAVFNGFHLFLHELAVIEQRRGTGTGAKLHERLVERGRELDAQGIITDSWLTTVGFYYHLGYRMPGAVFLIHDLRVPDVSSPS
jgi:predicted N-acetyltransferase YhbS